MPVHTTIDVEPAMHGDVGVSAWPRHAPTPAVVLVAELFPPAIGGSGVLLENIYKRLGGEPATVITEAVTAARQPDPAGLRVFRMPMAARQWGITNVRSLRRHLRIARRLRLECRDRDVIVHCARALPEGVAALLMTCRYGRPPYICWAHGEELAYARTSRELSALQSQVLLRASAVVANSRNTAGYLRGLGVAESKLHVVHPGVDARRFARDTRDQRSLRSRFAPHGQVVLLSVGRLQRRKGHDFAIRACAELKGLSGNFTYVIVGDGQERARLERLVDEVGLRERVHFVGEVQEDLLPDYYAAADVFVHPNRIDGADLEGFGIVFLEAAAAGLPTIGGDSGGVPEAVEHGVTGLLVNGTDVGEIASALRLLVEQQALRHTMGEAGRARVVRDFTWERAASQIAALHCRIGASQ